MKNTNKRFTRKAIRPQVTLKDMLQTTFMLMLILFFAVWAVAITTDLNFQIAEAKEEIQELNSAVQNKELDILEGFEQESYTEDEIESIVDKIEEVYVEEVTWKTDEEIVNLTFDFLKKFEGLHLEAYGDYKQWSIGYGTISQQGEVITQVEAERRCKEVIKAKLLQINRLADNLEWNKKVALISFMYNVGYKGDVLRYAARGDDASVIYLIGQYNSAGGKVLKGLQKRRAAEISYYKGELK